jgi:hypothetical protein
MHNSNLNYILKAFIEKAEEIDKNNQNLLRRLVEI